MLTVTEGNQQIDNISINNMLRDLKKKYNDVYNAARKEYRETAAIEMQLEDVLALAANAISYIQLGELLLKNTHLAIANTLSTGNFNDTYRQWQGS